LLQGIAASRPGSNPNTDCQLVGVHPPRFTRYQYPVPGDGIAASEKLTPNPIVMALTA
jgi:hypothetical protein